VRHGLSSSPRAAAQSDSRFRLSVGAVAMDPSAEAGPSTAGPAGRHPPDALVGRSRSYEPAFRNQVLVMIPFPTAGRVPGTTGCDRFALSGRPSRRIASCRTCRRRAAATRGSTRHRPPAAVSCCTGRRSRVGAASFRAGAVAAAPPPSWSGRRCSPSSGGRRCGARCSWSPRRLPRPSSAAALT
jgi:hypothetical protein